jgi:hypothetical protein
MKNDFVCDLMEAIKVCQSAIYKMYCDQISECKYVKVGQIYDPFKKNEMTIK